MRLAAAAAADPGSAEAPAASLQRDSALQPLEQSPPPGLAAVPPGSVVFFCFFCFWGSRLREKAVAFDCIAASIFSLVHLLRSFETLQSPLLYCSPLASDDATASWSCF